MGEIIFNGRSSREIGLVVEEPPEYETPARRYDTVDIPGRNGSLILDTGCWENATRTYKVALVTERVRLQYTDMMNKFSEWIHSTVTYARLEDSYEPDYYRHAVFLEEISISNLYNKGGQAELTFDCKPQRFLKVGDEAITITTDTTMQNPTNFASLPIIHIYGNGILVVGEYTITINDTSEKPELYLDCELQDAYIGTTNKNAAIQVPNGFPILKPGANGIGFSGGITKVEVTPRWFTL